jgi:spermidine/putrescine transport system permease protein
MSRLRSFFMIPAAVLMLFTLAVPLCIVIAYSFLTRGTYGGVEQPWTLENYVRFAAPIYGLVFARSFGIAAVATLLCLVLAFPLALYITRSPRKHLMLGLVMLPFWTSLLIRLYAWMFLLRDTGLFNTILQRLGLIRDPLPLLYNDGAVLLGLLCAYLPFAVLPIYAALEGLDPSLVEAAADLGAAPRAVLWRVTIPLCAPGLRAAGILVFVASLGTYLTSDLLGGGRALLIGNLIQNQFTASRDWPFGAALSVILIAAAMTMLYLRPKGRELV